MSICIRYTRDEDRAKEVLNIGFFKILSNLSKYRVEVPFKAWIRKIMINTLINEFKKEKAHTAKINYVDEYFDNQTESHSNLAIDNISAKEIYDFIAQLPLATKHVFNLFYVEGYKHKEIAEMLGITEGTSKWHLNAAREKLKILITESETIPNKTGIIC